MNVAAGLKNIRLIPENVSAERMWFAF